jgi:hypothetical protein
MPRKKSADIAIPAPLPEKNDPDYFRSLVKDCVAAYEKLNNDSLAMDFCKVVDRRLRALILDDEEYRRETKSIYARQRLEEVQELDYLAGLAANEEVEDENEDDEEWVHPSERGKKGKKVAPVDRDMLNIRFKALQLKRDAMRDMANVAGDAERDTVNHVFMSVGRGEFEKLVTIEISNGSGDADFEELVGKKEDMPVGTSGKLVAGNTAKTKPKEDNADDFFDILEDGTIVEK